MVVRGSKRINKVQRLLLVFGIVAVGVLDLAFTSYLNGLDDHPADLAAVRTNVQTRSAPLQNYPLERPAAQDGPDTATPGDSFAEAHATSPRYFKASLSTVRTRRSRYVTSSSSRSQIVAAAPSQFDCRVVSYPYIGTGVYVQVTDSIGCLNASNYGNRGGRLLARARQSTLKRWQAINTLVAKLK